MKSNPNLGTTNPSTRLDTRLQQQPEPSQKKNDHDDNSNNKNESNTATPTTTTTTVVSEPIVLLNGFGVGSFHQHRLIPELLLSNDDDNSDDNSDDDDEDEINNRRNTNIQPRTVYCMDYLGQGRSWPKDCQDGLGEHEKDLQYSADMWCEQIIDFLEAIVLPNCNNNNEEEQQQEPPPPFTKVHLVGNSVGGHLAAHVAVRRPDLVASLSLLNPTPVWGSKLPGWDGHLPAPAIPKAVGRYLFDRIRDLNTVEQFLTATYSCREAFSDELMNQIRGCTLGNGGHAAFASIMWSPPLRSKGSSDFYDCLRKVSCDVLLVFGTDDPWCKPVFARNMLLALEERTTTTANKRQHQQRYIEITQTGHCPNHEAPKAVGHLVNRWVNCCNDNANDNANDARSPNNLSLVAGADTNNEAPAAQTASSTDAVSFVEDWGEMTIRERQKEDIQTGSWLDKIITSFM